MSSLSFLYRGFAYGTTLSGFFYMYRAGIPVYFTSLLDLQEFVDWLCLSPGERKETTC